MRFNTKELAHYASTRFGKADKEGALWMKECEGILKKKESEFASEVVYDEEMCLSLPSLHTEMVSAHRKSPLLLRSRAPCGSTVD